ncbi:MAG: glycosyltransferase family 2 protein [Candidatus Solibacter sp.]|nr:glycosyltransferase family 2 protein [Candidatus Solibacter sp.]
MRESISVFFPAYNDEHTIGGLVRETLAFLPELTDDYEVIGVNDGSRDGTGAILEQLRSEFPGRFRVVTHQTNRGYGGALQSGFAAARKDLVFYTDGDGQYDPSELRSLLQLMGPLVGCVNGFKLDRSDPWHRIAIGFLYNKFARFIFAIQLRDIDCDFRLIRRSLLEDVALNCTSGTVCVELVKKLELCPYLVEEVGVHHYPRRYGRSQFFRLRSLVTTLFQLLSLYTSLVLLPQVTGRDARSV